MKLTKFNVGDLVTRPEWWPDASAVVLSVLEDAVALERKGEEIVMENDDKFRIIYSKYLEKR